VLPEFGQLQSDCSISILMMPYGTLKGFAAQDDCFHKKIVAKMDTATYHFMYKSVVIIVVINQVVIISSGSS